MSKTEVKLNIKDKKKRKSLLNSIIRQVLTSLVILVILFTLMNFSAFYKIAENKVQEILGINNTQTLTNIIETPDSPIDIKNLEVITEFSEEKNMEIPNMNFEIAPLTDRIIIPSIGQNVPIIKVSSENLINKDFKALEKDIQDALRGGVVHYPGTDYSGDGGNVVITGHSSYFPWDPGRFKDVFALLHDVEVGDKVYVYHNQKKYVYQINEIFEVNPTNIDVLKQTKDEQLTLITCTPVGTNLRRLIVVAKPVLEN